MKKRWIILIIIIICSLFVAYNLFLQAKKDIVANKNLYINRGGSEPISLTETEFQEKIAAKGLEDAKAAVSSLSNNEVKLCQSKLCKDFENVFEYEYFPNRVLEREIIEGYLKTYFELNTLELPLFEDYVQENRDNKYFLPQKRNGVPKEIWSLKIIEDNTNYYFMYVSDQSKTSELFDVKNDPMSQLFTTLREVYGKNEDFIEKLEVLEKNKGKILDSFKLGFMYKVSKSTFVEQNKIKAFFYKFNNVWGAQEVREIWPTISSTSALFKTKENLERLNITLSRLFIENYYYQIFEKHTLLGSFDTEEESESSESEEEIEETSEEE